MFHWVLNASPIIVSEYVSEHVCVFCYYFHFESIKFRSSRSQMSFKIRYFWKFLNIYRKTRVLELLYNKFAVLQVCKFIKKRLQHRCFPLNIAKFLRTTLLIEQQIFLKLCLKPARTSPWRSQKAFTKLLWLLYW